MNEPAPAHRADQLRGLIGYLLEERGMADQLADIETSAGNDERMLFRVFRALVNTRPAAPASEAFLAEQDDLLRSMIASKGIATLADVTFAHADPRLALWQGDITLLAVDAIVNAANSEMLGCWQPNHGCIDNAIHTFAGVQLRLACARIMEAQGHEEPTGRAQITPAFNLPAKFVLHTVGPIVQGPLNATYIGQLASCYTSCLTLAAENGCASVAFCCISTGVFMFPADKAADIAVRTVRAWLDAHPESPIETVVFDVFSDSDRHLYERLFKALGEGTA